MTTAVLLLCAMALPLPVSADEPQHPGDAAAIWRELTQLDVEAAYRLLQENHPAAAPEARDARFVTALNAAHARAPSRIAGVSSYEGYVATLGEMAASLGDGHLSFSARHVPRQVRWAGILAGRQEHNWVVVRDDPGITGTELQGSRLLGCDGHSAEELGREVLHYLTDVDNPAALALAAGWLLIDQGNPFLTPPAELHL